MSSHPVACHLGAVTLLPPDEDRQKHPAHRPRLDRVLFAPAGFPGPLDLPVQVRVFDFQLRDPLAKRRQFSQLGVPAFVFAVGRQPGSRDSGHAEHRSRV